MMDVGVVSATRLLFHTSITSIFLRGTEQEKQIEHGRAGNERDAGSLVDGRAGREGSFKPLALILLGV